MITRWRETGDGRILQKLLDGYEAACVKYAGDRCAGHQDWFEDMAQQGRIWALRALRKADLSVTGATISTYVMDCIKLGIRNTFRPSKPELEGHLWRQLKSLDAPISHRNHGGIRLTLADILPGPDIIGEAERCIERDMLMGEIRQVSIENLPPLQARSVWEYYAEEYTLDSIAQSRTEGSRSREGIRQQALRGLANIQKALAPR